MWTVIFFFQAEDGIRDLVRSRGLGDVYKRQLLYTVNLGLSGVPLKRLRILVFIRWRLFSFLFLVDILRSKF